MRFRKLSAIFLVLPLALSMNVTSARADKEADEDTSAIEASIAEKQNALSELEKQKKSLSDGRSNVQKIINGLQANKKELTDYVASLDAELNSIEANINSYNKLMDEKENEIEETEAEYEAANELATAQYESMKERIRFMYERGNDTYIDLLMSSKNFGDMLNRADYIEQITEYDRKMLNEYTLVVEYTKKCKEELEKEQEVLEEAKAAAMAEQDNMNALIDEKQVQIEAFESDISNQKEAIAEYDAEIASQNEEIAQLEAQVAAEKERLEAANERHYSGGGFVWPAPSYTRISDEYGWRMHPTLHVEKFHNGIDMAAPGGSPILAASDGEVAATGYSSSMGNYVMIDHGDKLYTIYMHASSISVSKGQTVSAGDQIGKVGSTGRSTGNHLHFGVRLNGDYVNPNSYL